MTTQLELKTRGMTLSAQANLQWLAQARRIAYTVARAQGECSIEDVRLLWPGEFPTGNWVGSIFKGWEFTGKRIRALHDGGHAREIKVWKPKKLAAQNPVLSRPVAIPTVSNATPHSLDLFSCKKDQHGREVYVPCRVM